MADEMNRMRTSDIVAASERSEQETMPASDDGMHGGEPVTSLGMGRAGAQPEVVSGGEQMSSTATMKSDEDAAMTLLSEEFMSSHRQRWGDIQAKFVDDPREAMEEADGLVAEVIHELASRFAEQKTSLESKWHSGGDVSTEDLRVALRMYRAFFQRLMAA